MARCETTLRRRRTCPSPARSRTATRPRQRRQRRRVYAAGELVSQHRERAQTFAQRLRERGHRAFVASAPATNGQGTWHRVRIGPFNSLRDVSQYRSTFESRERLPTFVVRRDEDRAPRH
ncbi:MAG: SPOR domain-containing protein [Polyangiales bacterium]